MIRIGKPYVIIEKDTAYLKAPVGENCGSCYACMKTMIPLDIMGRLENFRDSFDVDAYNARREEIFEELIRFSHRPEAASARESVRQILQLAKQEGSEAGKLFIECLGRGTSGTR